MNYDRDLSRSIPRGRSSDTLPKDSTSSLTSLKVDSFPIVSRYLFNSFFRGYNPNGAFKKEYNLGL